APAVGAEMVLDPQPILAVDVRPRVPIARLRATVAYGDELVKGGLDLGARERRHDHIPPLRLRFRRSCPSLCTGGVFVRSLTLSQIVPSSVPSPCFSSAAPSAASADGVLLAGAPSRGATCSCGSAPPPRFRQDLSAVSRISSICS